MKEIEVLVRVIEKDEKKVISRLEAVSKYKYKSEVYDVYYYDPLRQNLCPNENMELKEAFRLRKKGGKNYITYKVDNFADDGKWLYSDENETEIGSFEEVSQIINRLGLKKLVVVDMIKYFYETDDYNIAFEHVEQLGSFLEVESKSDNVEDVEAERGKIEKFIESLDIEVTQDLGVGKPELLIKKIGVLEK